VLVEVGWTQDAAVRALFEGNPDLTVGASVKDGAGRSRVATAKKR